MTTSRTSAAIWRWEEGAARTQDQPAVPSVKRSVVEALVGLAIGLVLLLGFGKRILGTIAIAIGVFVLFSALVAPPVYAGFRKLVGWLAWAAGVGLTWLLLVPFFYICFTSGRIVLAFRRKDPLHRGFPSKEETYWVPHETPKDPARYQRQY